MPCWKMLDAVDVTRVILLDNASNNKKAMDLGANAYTVLWCCNHTLQFIVYIVYIVRQNAKYNLSV